MANKALCIHTMQYYYVQAIHSVYPLKIKLDNGHAIMLKYVCTIDTAYANNAWAIDTSTCALYECMIVFAMACDR